MSFSKFFFDASALAPATPEAAAAALSEFPAGTATSAGPGHIWVRDPAAPGGARRQPFNASTADARIDYREIASAVRDYINHIRNKSSAFSELLEMPVRILSIGELVQIRSKYFDGLEIGNDVLGFGLSLRLDDYFDTQVVSSPSGEGVCYTNGKDDHFRHGVRHSGDIHACGGGNNILFHAIYVNPEQVGMSDSLVVQQVGYKHPLAHFTKSRPLFVVMLQSGELGIYVPSLSAAFVGDARHASIGIIRRSVNGFSFEAIPPVLRSGAVSTGLYNPGNAVADALRAATPLVVTPAAAAPAIANDPFAAALARGKALATKVPQKTQPPLSAAPIDKTIVFLPANLPGVDKRALMGAFPEAKFIQFGTRLTPAEPGDTEASTPILPCFAPQLGTAILSRGEEPAGDFGWPVAELARRAEAAAQVIVVGTGAGTPDELTGAAHVLLNAVFVLWTPKATVGDASLVLFGARGPQSALLRGELGPDGCPAFTWLHGYAGALGASRAARAFARETDVTDLLDGAAAHGARWVRPGEARLVLGNRTLMAEQVVTDLSSFSIDECRTLFAQLAALVPSDKLPDLVRRMQEQCAALVKNPELDAISAEIAAAFAADPVDPERIRQLLGRRKGLQRSGNRELLALLGELYSIRGALTLNWTDQQTQRAKKVAGNVAAAGAATADDFVGVIDAAPGALIVSLNTAELAAIAAAPSDLGRRAVDFGDGRCMYLDEHAEPGSLVALGLEVAPWGKQQRCELPLALPNAQLMLPLPSAAKDCRELSSLRFVGDGRLCDEPGMALVRIAIVNYLSGALGLKPSGDEAAFALVRIYADAMRALIAATSSAAALSFDDTVALNIRGLFIVIATILSRGAGRPLSPIAYLFGRRLPGVAELALVPADHLWILDLLLQAAPYTRMDVTDFVKNVQTFFSAVVRKAAVALSASLVEKKKHDKKAALEAARRKTDEVLHFSYLAIQTLRALLASAPAAAGAETRVLDAAPAARLLQWAPAHIHPDSGAGQLRRFMERVACGTAVPSTEVAKIVETAANIEAKRSAMFRDLKAQFVAALAAGSLAEFEEQFWAEYEKMRAGLSETARMQNLQAYRAATATAASGVEKTVADMVRGDAERLRGFWTVTGTPVDADELNGRLSTILGHPLALERGAGAEPAAAPADVGASLTPLQLRLRGTPLLPVADALAAGEISEAIFVKERYTFDGLAPVLRAVTRRGWKPVLVDLLTAHLLAYEQMPLSDDPRFLAVFAHDAAAGPVQDAPAGSA